MRHWKLKGLIGSLLAVGVIGCGAVHAKTLTGKQADQEITAFINTASHDNSAVVNYRVKDACQKKGDSRHFRQQHGTITYSGDNTENIKAAQEKGNTVDEINVLTNGKDVFAQQEDHRFVQKNDALDDIKEFDRYKIASFQLTVLQALRKSATVTKNGDTETITVQLNKKTNKNIQKQMWAGIEKGKTKQLVLTYRVDAKTHQPLSCHFKFENYQYNGDLAHTYTWSNLYEEFSKQNQQGSIPMPSGDQLVNDGATSSN